MAAALTLSGCSSLHYLLQAGKGQLGIINHSRPIEEVLRDERTPPRIRQFLSQVPAIKAFGESQGLKATKNYSEYVQLDRPVANWVVSACESLRFKSVAWSFPVVGSFPYLGWFDLDDARKFARELKSQGYDVDLRGALAYSTLGWFKDPVMSSMITVGDEAIGELVNVILHESVHATIYINDEAYFNESVASFIADRLTPIYLEKNYGSASKELKAYLASEIESRKREKLLHDAYVTLDRLYSSTQPDSEKKAEKARILTELQAKLGARREINNATLVQFRTYGTGTNEFEELLKSCHGDWKLFLRKLLTLKQDSFSKSHQEDLKPVLQGLTAR